MIFLLIDIAIYKFNNIQLYKYSYRIRNIYKIKNFTDIHLFVKIFTYKLQITLPNVLFIPLNSDLVATNSLSSCCIVLSMCCDIIYTDALLEKKREILQYIST